MDDLAELKREYERKLSLVKRTAATQRIWWIAVLLLGAALGYAIAEMTIAPVTVIVPPCGGIEV